MDDATKYLIAVPAPLADAARAAAAQWDAAGAATMFRSPTLCPTNDPANLYVFSYGWIADESAPGIQAAIPLFPGGLMVAAHPFEAALAQAGLARTRVDMPPGADAPPAA